jgi:hypothetical protein
MKKWFAAMPKVEVEPGVFSVPLRDLALLGYDTGNAGYDDYYVEGLGDVNMLYHMRQVYWQQGILCKEGLIMKEFGGRVAGDDYKRRAKDRIAREPPIGPWTEELTMTLKLGRLPWRNTYCYDGEWWPLDPWHPNHTGLSRRSYEWNTKLRRFVTDGKRRPLTQ